MAEEDINEVLFDIIEELTTSGKEYLDMTYVDKLKTLCKVSCENISIAYRHIFNQLRKDHSQIRFSCVLIIDRLFHSSPFFRKMLLNDLREFFALTLQTEQLVYVNPVKTAKALKQKTTELFQQWLESFGHVYKRLQLGYDYLKNVKDIKFIDKKKRDRQAIRNKCKKDRIVKYKLDQVDIQIYFYFEDILSLIKQLEACFNLLVPKIVTKFKDQNFNSELENIFNVDFCTRESSQTKSIIVDHSNANKTSVDPIVSPTAELITSTSLVISSSSAMPVENAIISNSPKLNMASDNSDDITNFNLTIKVNKSISIKMDSSNHEIIKTLQDLYKEVSIQLENRISYWLETMQECDSANTGQMNKIFYLKQLAIGVMEKYKELKFVGNDDSEDEDVVFEDVPEKFDEGHFFSENDFHISKNCPAMEENDPTDQPCSSRTLKDSAQASTFNVQPFEMIAKEKLLKIAPVVEYGFDLHHRGKDKIETFESTRPQESLHRFWKHSDEKDLTPPHWHAIRVMQFPVQIDPIKHVCGFPLPNGKKCQRMDKFKCPFHGRIVDRDSDGVPLNEEDRENNIKRRHKQEIKDREKYAKELSKSLGINLISKRIKKKKTLNRQEIQKQRYGRLIDVKSLTSKQMLKKKVLNRKKLDKANSIFNEQVTKKHADKFGSNFNYY